MSALWVITLGGAFYFGFVSRDPLPPEYQEFLFEQVLEEAEERKRREGMRETELMVIPGEVIRESSLYGQAGQIHLDFQNIEPNAKNKEPLTGRRIREILAPALVSSDLVGFGAV